MKMHFPKSKPNSITYPSYKNFDNQMFVENFNAEAELKEITLKKNVTHTFPSICFKDLNKYASCKKTILAS